MTKSHEKKFTREKIFDFEIFVLKYVSNRSESISTKKLFSTNFFWLSHFFTILVILAEKTKPHEKILHGKKIFDFDIFVLIYVSKHSESISTQKNRPKIYDFVIV